jgi:hypothetical protein
MYGILYKNSEYYNNKLEQRIIKQDETNKICLICWASSKEDMPVKCLKEFSYFISDCECNALFHDSCLKLWVKSAVSCPICRKKFSDKINKIDRFTIKFTTGIIIVLNFTSKMLAFISLYSLIHLIYICIYKVTFIEFIDHDECSDYYI